VYLASFLSIAIFLKPMQAFFIYELLNEQNNLINNLT
jgi:hypothetical protein